MSSLSNELSVLADDLVTCHSALKTNLISKGVEVLPTDKMSSLIDKVGSITTGKKWAEGNCGIGTINPTYDQVTYHDVNYSLDFVPSIVFVVIDEMKINKARFVRMNISNVDSDLSSALYDSSLVNANAYIKIENISKNGFQLKVSKSSTATCSISVSSWKAYE